MNASEIVAELKSLGRDSYKRVMLKHGVVEPVFGVKIEELKKIQKRIKTDYQLALELFATGNYDAQYLAGLITDDAKMTRHDLNSWPKLAQSRPIASYVIPSVAAGSAHGWPLALEWIESENEIAAVAGWSTLSDVVSIKPDAELDLATLRKLLRRIGETIHQQPDGVRYAMNGFVIALGSYVAPLTAIALETAEKIGRVEVDMGETSCKVPFAPAYIRKVEERGAIGKKRKSAKC